MRFYTLSLPVRPMSNARKALANANTAILALKTEREKVANSNLIPGFVYQFPNGKYTPEERMTQLDKDITTIKTIFNSEIAKYKADFENNIAKQKAASANFSDTEKTILNLLASNLVEDSADFESMIEPYVKNNVIRAAANAYAKKKGWNDLIYHVNDNAMNELSEDFFKKVLNGVDSAGYTTMFLNDDNAINDYIKAFELENEYKRGKGENYPVYFGYFTNKGGENEPIISPIENGSGEENGTSAAKGSIAETTQAEIAALTNSYTAI